MKEIEELKQLVYEKGLQTLLKRMEVVLSCRDLRALINNVIVSATIVDMDAVVRKIKEEWSVFGIKDVKINLTSQSVSFKIYGSCYIPEKYRGFIIIDWSASQTEECNYLKEIKEEYAEEKAMPLTSFINNGIEVEII